MKTINLNIKLNETSPVPLHFQLYQAMKAELFKSRQPAGSKLPSERSLAEALKLNRNTITKAYGRLEEENIAERQLGKRGLFVTVEFEKSYAEHSYPTLGLVLPEKMEAYICPERFSVLDYISGVIDTASELGFAATIIPLPPLDKPAEYLREWFDSMRDKLSGLIYLGDRSGVSHDHAFEIMLSEKSIPQVFIGGKSKFKHLGAVTVDVKNGMQSALDYLRENGHNRIGMIFKQVPKRNYLQLQSYTRHDDLIAAFEKCGLDVNPHHCISDFTNGESLAAQLKNMMALPERPTALMCYNDKVARYTTKILKKLNFRVPEDISVIGYDDTNEASEGNPQLTTLRQPRRQMGRSAVEIIAECRKHNQAASELNRQLPANLVIRQSVVRPDSDTDAAFESPELNVHTI